MANKVEIANSALARLGASPIMSLDDDAKAAQAIKNSFELCKKTVLRAHIWKCARKRLTITPTTTAPDFNYTYAFNLPSDYLRLVYIDGDPEYTIEGRQILSNEATLSLVYIYDIGEDIEILDALVVEALSCYLAWTISYIVTQDLTIKTGVYSDYSFSLRQAKSIDAKETPYQQLEANEFIDSRSGYPILDRSNR